jgi:hypothetical protein
MNRIDYNDENYYFGGIQEGPIGDPSIFPLSQGDVDRIVEENGGTGGNVDPEQKEITCIENGVKIIEPSGDFDGLSSVKVTVDVPQKTVKDDAVELSTTENGTVKVSAADYNVDGLKAVSVTVNVPSPSIKPEPVSLTFSENRTYTISAEEYNVDGLSSVDIVVDVPSAPSVTKFYYSNGFMSESNDTIITKQSYSSGSTLVSVAVGNNVETIGEFAFDSRGLTNVEISEGVTSIGGAAFFHCYNLSSIAIPNSVKNIGASAFNFCSGLTNVEISEGVTSIGENAFANCDNLSSVTIPDSVLEIGDNAFNTKADLNAKFVSTTPPPDMDLVFGHIGGGSGSGSGGRTLVIEVPEVSLEAYKAALPYYASLDVIVGY